MAPREESNSSYPEISGNDQQPLIEDESSRIRFHHRLRRIPGAAASHVRNHKYFCLFLFALTLILIGHGIAIYFIYFKCTPNNCLPIKVMSLNAWGMPATFGSEYKTERIQAIAKEISKAHYDIYLLEELWMEPDYYTVRASIPSGYHMTEFRELALRTCDGRVAPTACSGLSIVSKFPFVEVEFNSYTEHGDWTKATIDGEWFARKGVGRVRIHPMANITMDVFVTHTAADPDPRLHNYTNKSYREHQVQELMESYVSKSTADIVVLGGDFNAGPDHYKGAPYSVVRAHMTNCIEEIFYKLNEWLDAKYATYGNLQNTFSGHIYDPIIYDYIFYKFRDRSKVYLYTNWFELPLFKLRLPFTSMLNSTLSEFDNQNETNVFDGNLTVSINKTSTRFKRDFMDEFSEKIISFSDHEAVTTTLYLRFF